MLHANAGLVTPWQRPDCDAVQGYIIDASPLAAYGSIAEAIVMKPDLRTSISRLRQSCLKQAGDHLPSRPSCLSFQASKAMAILDRAGSERSTSHGWRLTQCLFHVQQPRLMTAFPRQPRILTSPSKTTACIWVHDSCACSPSMPLQACATSEQVCVLDCQDENHIAAFIVYACFGKAARAVD